MRLNFSGDPGTRGRRSVPRRRRSDGAATSLETRAMPSGLTFELDGVGASLTAPYVDPNDFNTYTQDQLDVYPQLKVNPRNLIEQSSLGTTVYANQVIKNGRQLDLSEDYARFGTPGANNVSYEFETVGVPPGVVGSSGMRSELILTKSVQSQVDATANAADPITDVPPSPWGTRSWSSFSFLLPDNFDSEVIRTGVGKPVIISQWWQTNSSKGVYGGGDRAEGIHSGSPPMEMSIISKNEGGEEVLYLTAQVLYNDRPFGTNANATDRNAAGDQFEIREEIAEFRLGKLQAGSDTTGDDATEVWFDVVVDWQASSVNLPNNGTFPAQGQLNDDGHAKFYFKREDATTYQESILYEGQIGVEGSTQFPARGTLPTGVNLGLGTGNDENYGIMRKIGVYTPFGANRPDTPAGAGLRTAVYFDEVREGATRADVDLLLINAGSNPVLEAEDRTGGNRSFGVANGRVTGMDDGARLFFNDTLDLGSGSYDGVVVTYGPGSDGPATGTLTVRTRDASADRENPPVRGSATLSGGGGVGATYTQVIDFNSPLSGFLDLRLDASGPSGRNELFRIDKLEFFTGGPPNTDLNLTLDAVADRDANGSGWGTGGGVLTYNGANNYGGEGDIQARLTSTSNEYSFDAPAPGLYTVWIEADTGGSGNDDSVWVEIDGASVAQSVNLADVGNASNDGGDDWVKFNNISGSAGLAWRQVRNSDAGGNPVQFFVPTAGTRTLRIAGREDGTVINRVFVTNTGATPGSQSIDRANSTPQDEIVSLDGSDVASREFRRALRAAMRLWGRAGFDTREFRDNEIVVTDLGDDRVAAYADDVIYLDDDAAGFGWFVDTTPFNSKEFKNGRTPEGVDLVSVLAHELGHDLGFDEGTGVMDPLIATGERTSGFPVA